MDGCLIAGSREVSKPRDCRFRLFQSLWNLTGISAAILLPRCLSNFRTTIIMTSNLAASRLGGKMSYRLVNRGHDWWAFITCPYGDSVNYFSLEINITEICVSVVICLQIACRLFGLLQYMFLVWTWLYSCPLMLILKTFFLNCSLSFLLVYIYLDFGKWYYICKHWSSG